MECPRRLSMQDVSADSPWFTRSYGVAFSLGQCRPLSSAGLELYQWDLRHEYFSAFRCCRCLVLQRAVSLCPVAGASLCCLVCRSKLAGTQDIQPWGKGPPLLSLGDCRLVVRRSLLQLVRQFACRVREASCVWKAQVMLSVWRLAIERTFALIFRIVFIIGTIQTPRVLRGS